MPNLNNTYIYKDWILNLEYAGKLLQEFTRFDLYHQCEPGTICRAKGRLVNRANGEVIEPNDFAPSKFETLCSGCNSVCPPEVQRQMQATWQLMAKVQKD